MIHLPHKQYTLAPEKLSVSGALRQINRVILAQDGNLYNSSYYPHQDIKNLLKAFSIHKTQFEVGDRAKCNYCESQIEHSATLQVEHYRPKAKVDSGENDHTELLGYYWLGLEWTNLLLACPKCNGKDAKGNKFPIRGTRAVAYNPITVSANNNLTLTRNNCLITSITLQQEDPLLLNPEVDNPVDFLTFDVLGKIISHGQDPTRGDVSINTYRLNRDELLSCRQKVWNDFKNRINVDIAGHMAGLLTDVALEFNFNLTANQLFDRNLPTEEYTLWGQYINDNLPDFLVSLDGYYKNIFLSVHNNIVNGIP